MEFHPVAAIFPMLDGEEYETFKQDIKEHGLEEPIVTFKGQIIDGRNRFKACRELGIKPVYTEWDEDGSLVEFVVSLNLHRRHLSPSQIAMCGAKIMEHHKEEARARMKKTQFGADPAGRDISSGPSGRARDRAAASLQISPFPVEKADFVLKHGIPELAAAVRADQVAVHNAAEIAKLPPDEQRGVVGAGPEAMLEKAKEIRQEKKEAAPAPKREVQPVVAKGAAAVKKWLDDRVEMWAKSTDKDATTRFKEANEIRAGLCELP